MCVPPFVSTSIPPLVWFSFHLSARICVCLYIYVCVCKKTLLFTSFCSKMSQLHYSRIKKLWFGKTLPKYVQTIWFGTRACRTNGASKFKVDKTFTLKNHEPRCRGQKKVYLKIHQSGKYRFFMTNALNNPPSQLMVKKLGGGERGGVGYERSGITWNIVSH